MISQSERAEAENRISELEGLFSRWEKDNTGMRMSDPAAREQPDGKFARTIGETMTEMADLTKVVGRRDWKTWQSNSQKWSSTPPASAGVSPGTLGQPPGVLLSLMSGRSPHPATQVRGDQAPGGSPSPAVIDDVRVLFELG